MIIQALDLLCSLFAPDVDGGRLSSPGTVVRSEHVAPKSHPHRVPRSQPNPSRRFRTHNLLSSTQHVGQIPEDTFHDACANLRAVSVAEFALVLLKHEAADAGVRDRGFDPLCCMELPDSVLNRSAFRIGEDSSVGLSHVSHGRFPSSDGMSTAQGTWADPFSELPIHSKRRRHFAHRTKTFKLSRDPKFLEKMTDVLGLYLNTSPRKLGDNWIELMQTDRCQDYRKSRAHARSVLRERGR